VGFREDDIVALQKGKVVNFNLAGFAHEELRTSKALRSLSGQCKFFVACWLLRMTVLMRFSVTCRTSGAVLMTSDFGLQTSDCLFRH
jgi:hypothetical protein